MGDQIGEQFTQNERDVARLLKGNAITVGGQNSDTCIPFNLASSFSHLLGLWQLGVCVLDLLISVESSQPFGDVLVWRDVNLTKASDVHPWIVGEVGNGWAI